ncbi:MAG: amino acid adenylation domain-containing protein, partial [Bacteroidota bacterium]
MKLSDYKLLDKSSRNKFAQVVEAFNHTSTPYPDHATIHSLFREMVVQSPDQVAMEWVDEVGQPCTCTYAQLDQDSDGIARFLQSQGIQAEETVALLLESFELLIPSVLGILKCGAAYTALSPSFPFDRNKYILTDTAARLLLSEKKFIKELHKLQWECAALSTFVCLDCEDVYKEEEAANELMKKELWDYVGEESVDDISGGGWVNSFTGENLSRLVMDEYGDNILKKLKPLLRKTDKVLEIGCSSGISMFRLARLVAEYHGTDLSDEILKKTELERQQRGLSHVKLHVLPAHQVQQTNETDFDVIIINSVIQCFNGHNYLRQVLASALALLKNEGLIFIGDVMDQDSKSALIDALWAFKRANVGKGYQTKTDWSNELFISRNYFHDLRRDYPEIQAVIHSEKIYTEASELTDFRYDMVLQVNKQAAAAEGETTETWHKWQLGKTALAPFQHGEAISVGGPRNLAYISYTSGTTGKPKGVQIEHRSVVRLVKNTNYIQIDPKDKLSQTAPLSFDASTFEIWGALLNGATVCAIAKNDLLNPTAFEKFLKAAQVTICWLTASLFNRLLDECPASFASLRVLLVGGDTLSTVHVNRVRAEHLGLEVINGYGPTENTTFSACFSIDQAYEKSIPIGKPVANSQCYVLNTKMEPVPVGMNGELYVSGDGLARGYLNDAILTAEKFIDHPFKEGEKIYKTGDLAKWLPDGTLRFLGRNDDQVKIRGFRVELGEIENTIRTLTGVKEVVVTVRKHADEEKYLCAYLIAEGEFRSEDLKKDLLAYLPAYMVPTYLVALKEFPLNANGKVEKRLLPDPQLLNNDQDKDYTAPRTPLEKDLAGVWQAVLSLPLIGIQDNFFAIGGHSLKATQVVSRVQKELGLDLTIREMFMYPTLLALSSYLAKKSRLQVQAIVPVASQAYYELSYAQQRLWLLDQIDGGSAHYNMPAALRLSGQLDYGALNQAFGGILERHESLRTCFRVGADGQPIQVIQAAVPLAIAVTDLSALPAEAQALSIGQLVEEEASQVFDLSQDRMLRASLLQLAAEEHILLVTMHHIASDGWSMGILVNEFTALYQAYLQGQENPLPALPIQYADYAHWQRNWLQGAVLEEQLSYWITQLASLPVVHGLPLDHPRPKAQTFAGNNYLQQLDAASSQAFTAFCQSQGATLFMGLHAAFSVLLSRYSNEKDIVVGSPIANREQAEVAGLIGFFVNTIVLRSDLSESPSFKSLLAQSKQTLLDAYAHQQVPFEQIVERLQPERSLTHSPLFQVLLMLQNNEQGQLTLPGLTLRAVEQGVGIAKYDLTLTVHESAEGLWLGWEYNTDLFESSTIARMATHFEGLLQGLLAAPQASVFTIEMLSEAERHQQLVEWNDTARDYPADKYIQELFEEQVTKNPDAVAVVFEDQQLTYGELNRQANQLAHYLIEHQQVKPDSLVGICVERSLEMLIGILGILKAGGAYVPLDPDYPEARLAYMLEDAKLSTVLTQSHLLSRTPISEVQAFCLDDTIVQAQLRTQSIDNIPVAQLGLQSHHLAYVIYTSGSTGNPKGVMVAQRNVVNFLASMCQKPGISVNDCLLAVTSTSFDIHGLELFLPLMIGAKLVIASKMATTSPDVLLALMTQHQVSLMQATPATWKMLLGANWQQPWPLKVLCGGEELSLSLATRLLNHPMVELWNMYGPTETTIWSCIKHVLPDEQQVLLGQPIINTQVYVVANTGNLAPVAVAGELLIGGVGVTRGYLNRPDLTAEKFIANPFYDSTNPASSERLYKTGDLVRWLPEGNLEFLGRIDHQVKIRGFRIELGEIESQLMRHPQVKDAVVMVNESGSGEKQLVGYVVSRPLESQHMQGEAQLGFSLFYFGAEGYATDNKYDLYLKAAKFADEQGFEAIWTPERHFDAVGALYPNPSILSAALSTITSRVKLRAGSVVIPLHDPVRVAEEWAVVDNLSNGRVGLAIASGWHTRDFILAPENFGSRKEKVREGIGVLRKLWEGSSIIRRDGHGKDVEIQIFPKPIQNTLPLWLTAAGSPESFVEAGRLGTHLLTHLLGQTIEELSEKIVLYRESLAKHGHDPKQGRVTLMIHTFLGDDLQQTIDKARTPFIRYMRAHISLLIPFLKSLDIETDDVSEADLESIAAFAFERYVKTASLIGTPRSVLKVVDRLKNMGVDEVACLIDWMDTAAALQGLAPLHQLQQLSRLSLLSARELMEHCSSALPHYMIPSSFVVLDALPLTPNGKVDRKALPKPDVAPLQAMYVAPRTRMEQILSEIWQEVLGVERIGTADNFFQLGGHSLLVMQVIALLQQQGLSMAARQLFTTPTLGDLAEALDHSATTNAPAFQAPANLIPADCAQITPDMLPLVSLTSEEIAHIVSQVPGGVSNIKDIYPLVPLQEGILFHYMMHAQSDPYVLASLFRLRDSKAVTELLNALQFMIDRHEVLRTAVLWDNLSVPVQVVCRQASLPVTWLELDPAQDAQSQMQALCAPDKQWMDLSLAPLLRVQVALDTQSGQYFVLMQFHHVISDHVGLEIIQKEVSVYQAGLAASLPEPVPYRKFVAHALHQANQHDATAFFRQMLGEVTEPTLPFDLVDVQGDGSRIVEAGASVPAEVASQLRQITQEWRMSPAALFHTAWALVVAACTGQQDVVFGTVLSGRLQGIVGAESMLGVFINTLPFRVKLGDQQVRQVMRQVQESLLNLLPYEQASLALAQRCSGISGNSPLFSALFNYRHAAQADTIESNDAVLEVGIELVGGQERTNYPFNLSVDDLGAGFDLVVQVDSSVSAERIIGYMQTAVAGLVEALLLQPDQAIGSIAVLPEAERQQQLVEWNDTATQYPADKCIQELFEQQVTKNPDAVAVVFEDQQLTYGELNRHANQLAHYLIEHQQVKPDSLVGICIDRSLEMVIGILGILKAGGAYVPLDPDYPEARLAYMLDDAQLSTVLTQSHVRSRTPISEAQALCLDDTVVQAQLRTQSIENIPVQQLGLQSHHLAYVIYTSGSTGQPKGSLLSHAGLTNLALAQIQGFGVCSESRVLQFASLAFDAATSEWCMALVSGARLVVLPPAVAKSPDGISAIVAQAQVTHATLPPVLLPVLPRHSWQSVHTLVVAGDTCGEHLAALWSEGRRFINAYGPSETTVCATVGVYAPGQSRLPIGQPLPNIQVYILSKNQDFPPIGIGGELHIGGVGLSRGYLNRPDLTAEKFIPNPFYDLANPASSERLYKTGDMVRWLPDGNLEFLGRIDHQVKIRGFRIELGEIENALTWHPEVREAIVLAKESSTGDKRLVAYVVDKQVDPDLDPDLPHESQADVSQPHTLIDRLRQHLSHTLPDYMLPSAFVLLDRLPLTPNGKVDRQALPDPDLSQLQASYVAPQTATELILCEIWQAVLGVERVGLTDNFFQLGGHSLLVMQVIARLQKQGLSMVARQLFITPTLGELAQALDSATTTNMPVFQAPANLIPADCAQITPAMLPLVSLTSEEIEIIVSQVPGGATQIEDIYPLAPLQEGILFHHRMSTQGDPYVLPVLFRLKDSEVVREFQEALQFIIDRHAVLRTAILWNDLSVPVQVVYRQARLPVTWLELDSVQEAQAQMQALCAPQKQWMDLGQAPLLRLQVAQDIPSGQYFVLLQLHHVISDHVGLDIIQREIEIYLSGLAASLPEPVPYREFVAHALHQANQHLATAFFQQMLSEVTEPTLPFALVDVQGDGSRIVEAQASIPTELASQLRQISRDQRMSPAVFFHTAWALVVAACSGQQEVVFGTVLSGRLQGTVGAETMLGVFINTLPLRVKLGNSSVTRVVQQVQEDLLNLLPYEQASLALAQRCSGVSDGSPLFSALLNYRHSSPAPADHTENIDSAVENDMEYLGGQERTNYPFTLSVDDLGTGFALDVQVDSSVSAERIIGYMQTAVAGLVEALLSQPNQAIGSIAVLPEAERHQQLVEWNDTATQYPADKCMQELFEEQVTKNPDAVAVVFEDQQLTYGELNRHANQLAHYLIKERQVKPDSLVGICLDRSLEMVIGILGILKAGGAYVPLDPDYPEARLAYMLADAQLSTVLMQSHLRSRTPISEAQALCLDDTLVQAQLHTQSIENIPVQHLGLQSNHLAYVIYTSGSTGQPKGVLVEHHSVINLGLNIQAMGLLTSGDQWGWTASYAFDASVQCITQLILGRSLNVISNQRKQDPFLLLEVLGSLGVIDCTPMMVEAWFAAGIDYRLPNLIIGGEAISSKLWNLLVDWQAKYNKKAINVYGPTECTVNFSGCVIEGILPHIGKALGNTKAYVLNGDASVCGQGIPGELYIGGVGVARGYLNRPDLTAERFMANPFYDPNDPASSERLYKTGDLVRWLSDGKLEFLARIDHQVKIRGFRIELGEIEHALTSYVIVRDAVVLAKASSTGDKRLVAYVVTDESKETIAHSQELIDRLRQHLSQTLPDYMLPSAFILLDRLPLTLNGKVDRKALPEPDMALLQASYVAPRTETERVLCEIWQEVLGVEQIGITDNFFQRGGHSLSATRLVARINQVFKVTLPLKAIFTSPTLEALVQALLQLERGLARPALVRVPREQILWPSFAQQRLWLLDQIDGGSTHYHMPAALRLTGQLNYAALNQAFGCILERHESLRTCFRLGADGQPIQVIQAAEPLLVPVTDLSYLPDGEREKQMAHCVEEEASRVFDLSQDRMLRVSLLQLAAEEHILLVTMHHIASDGWSMSILVNEFTVLYQTYIQGQENPLPALPIQYADYAHWQRNWLQGAVLEEQLSYWITQLASLPVVHSLPLDHPRPQIQTYNGKTFGSHLDADLSNTFQALCQSEGATLFMGLHAAFSVLLSRYSNEKDIVVGSPIANREQMEVADLIGFFVNTLVLRSDLSGSPSFRSLLAQSKQMLLDAYAHQQVPFEQMVGRLQPERNLHHSPLFQVMLVLQNNAEGKLELPGLTLSPVEQGAGIAKYDLTLTVHESNQGLWLGWEYNTDLFEASTIARMATHFEVLLQGVLAAPQESVFAVEMLSAAERHQQLVEWNATAMEYPADQCMQELFEEQVTKNPDAVAVVFEDQQLTYGELNHQANQLAHYLIKERQVKPDSLVGICLDRSLEMVIGILGILKAGGAYVPLDPDYPEARLAYMLADAQLSTVLMQSHLRSRTPISEAQALCLDDTLVQAQLHTQSIENIPVQHLGLQSNHLAYVIYTSGSTGQPKGVLVEHHSVINLGLNIQAMGLLTSGDQWGWTASYAFDASVQCITQLILGRSLNVISNQRKQDPFLLLEVLGSLGVIDCTPMMVEAWFAAGIDYRLPNLIIGGEAISSKLWNLLVDWQAKYNKKAINVYGPTECTVNFSGCVIEGILPHIGKALGNTKAYVLNGDASVCGQGIPGELYIGGVGVARGYLNRPDLTAERFMANPFYDPNDPASSERLYKTGDLVRWLSDGKLEFLARIDHQVKIRGFRIELGEIEHALTSYVIVRDAVVLAKASSTGDKRLVAYVVTDESKETIAHSQELIDRLRQHLRQTLPEYMLPAVFVLLDHLPLTPNGKVDRQALPDPDLSQLQA